MNKFRMASAVVLAPLALLIVSVTAVAAQGPTDTPQVAYLDNQPHSIGANSSQLYRFDYVIKDDGTRPLASIRLVNGTKSGLSFEVWTVDELHNLAITLADVQADKSANAPIGRGTAANVNCDTGAVSGGTTCFSPDLVWIGSFGSGGSYFVRVLNSTSTDRNYQLLIQGSGVNLAPQSQLAAAAPSQNPAAAPPLVASSTNPASAVAIDNQPHTLAGGGATLQSFNYAVNSDGTRPVVTFRLINGTRNGMNFEIWTANQLLHPAATLADFQANKSQFSPVGRGTAANVNCDTGAVSGSGRCFSPDLTWLGALGSPGTYYVRVLNGSNAEGAFQLVMETR